MSELTREKIILNLAGKIDDTTYDRIRSFYPLSSVCPTCGDRKAYRLGGRDYECDCEIQRLLQQHYFAANIGREYHDICLDHFIGTDKDSVVPLVQEYLDDFDGNFHYGLGLSFSGPVGTGKTFAMCCVLKELIKRGRNVYFVTFEELINVWGSSYYNDESKRILEDKLKSAEVLGLDEVRTDPRNKEGFLANGFDSVIRHRTSNLLPTLVTTNMEPEEEYGEFGKVYSLLSARNLRVKTKGEDLRMEAIRQRNYELKKLNERRPVC